MTARGRTVAVVGCAVGAGLVLLAGSNSWRETTVSQLPPLASHRQSLTGAAIHPWLPALALVALAGAGALLASRGLARTVVGVLLTGCGFGMAVTGAQGGWTPWPLVGALGGALVIAGGAVAAVRGRSWPGLGAGYERAAAPVPVADADGLGAVQTWDAMDRGDDPTS